jgi:hypothetical protein
VSLLKNPAQRDFESVFTEVEAIYLEVISNSDNLRRTSLVRTASIFVDALMSNLIDAATILRRTTNDSCKVKLAEELKSSVVVIDSALSTFNTHYRNSKYDLSTPSGLVSPLSDRVTDRVITTKIDTDTDSYRDRYDRSRNGIQTVPELLEELIVATTGMEAPTITDSGVRQFTKAIFDAKNLLPILMADNQLNDEVVKLNEEHTVRVSHT